MMTPEQTDTTDDDRQVGQAGRSDVVGRLDHAEPNGTSTTSVPPLWWLCSARLKPLVSRSIILQVTLAVIACALFVELSAGPRPTIAPKSQTSASLPVAAAAPRVCDSLGCVVTAAQTVRYANRSVDPCTDFFHFACGRFAEAHTSDSRNALGVRDVLRRRNRERLLQLLSQSQHFNSSSAISKARLFFFSCVQAFRVSLNSVADLVSVLKPLGGLDLLNTWRPDQWDFNTVLANASRLHLTQAFFTLTWDRELDVLDVKLPKLSADFPRWDVGSSRYHAVEARVGRAMREVFYYMEKDAEVLIRDSKQPNAAVPRDCTLNASNSSDINAVSPCVEEIVRDILSVQGELFAIDPKRWSQSSFAPSLTVKVTFAEMVRLVPQIDWRRLLDALFGKNSVPDSVLFQIPSREHMVAVGRIIENTRIKRLHHFLMWPVIRRYLVAIGPIYATLGEELNRNYDSEQLKTREEQCLGLMDEHMAPAVHALLLSLHIGQDSVKHVRRHLLNDVIDQLNESFGWMSEETQRKARFALRNLNINFGYTMLIQLENALDLYYRPIDFHVLDFFGNLKELYEFNRPGKILYEFPTKGPPESVPIQHIFAHNTLWIPFGALQAPWYHVDVPAALNAASLGSLIFEALAVPFIQIHMSPQNLTDIWDRETESRFEHYYNCLLEKVRERPIRQELAVIEPARSGLRFAAYSMRVDPVPATYYMMADQFAYQLSYRLFERLTSQNNESSVLVPGLPITSASQAFFMAFTQARCRNDYALWDESLVGASKTLQVPESYVINQLVQDDPRFREAFKCEPLPPAGTDREVRQCSLF
ncbi:endothelin-converting enzyme-like 1 [Amphibalanus amphitrite]|uniref:endothelin-converting enzyme-like 1 n=1 Tax=Amphibalanus amphitrite TaxID=1232801 RepID=UPI001C9035EE|nr:endothelin-converting enzyme-like 1 [Amphibalanus amphitrite]XP_043202691.1 endothelin-converting enzyme-like 1 [Amphibalanus amphitrite]